MPGAVYLCNLGVCDADCAHGVPCVVWRTDAEHPHPTHRGRLAHIGYDPDAGLNHEWDGKAGRCRTSTPPEEW